MFPTDSGFWLRIGMSLLCGVLVGLDRQLRGKPAGIRTSILICMGSMLFVRMGSDLQSGPAADPTRVVGQVVVGVGFLGAGAILSRKGRVVGLTSAAVIWVLAAIGAFIGLERHGEALATALVAWFVLTGMEWLERWLPALRRGVYRRAPEDPKE